MRGKQPVTEASQAKNHCKKALTWKHVEFNTVCATISIPKRVDFMTDKAKEFYRSTQFCSHLEFTCSREWSPSADTLLLSNLSVPFADANFLVLFLHTSQFCLVQWHRQTHRFQEESAFRCFILKWAFHFVTNDRTVSSLGWKRLTLLSVRIFRQQKQQHTLGCTMVACVPGCPRSACTYEARN